MTISSSSTPATPESKNDLDILRNYITARDATQYDSLDESIVVVDLTHSNLQQRHAEIRFYKKDSLDQLRQRIHQKTGTPASQQHLQVIVGGGQRQLQHDNNDNTTTTVGASCSTSNNSNEQILLEIPPETSGNYFLAYFGIEFHGMRIHCIDLDPYSGSARGAYEDTTLVEKYKMTEDEYASRKNTLRAWGQEQKERDANFSYKKHAQEHRELVEAQRQHKMGLSLPSGFFVDSAGQVVRDEPDVDNYKSALGAEATDGSSNPEEYGKDSVAHVELQARCQIEPGARRGTVAYIGQVAELPGKGYWVGVVLDEPVGSNDGSIKGGERYFDTPGEKYGALVRGSKVQCGDFPEECDFLSDDDDDEF